MDHRARQRYKKGNKENAEPEGLQGFKHEAAELLQSTTQKSRGPHVKPKRPADGKRRAQPAMNVQTQTGACPAGPGRTAAAVRKQSSHPPLSHRPPLGMYNGKLVQSKVACIWKLSSTVERAEAMASMRRPGGQAGALETNRGPKSGTVAPSGPQTGSSRPSATAAPAPLSSISRFPEGGPHPDSRPPHVHSQDKVTTETVEERRAKPAGWRDSKGDVLKRATMRAAQPEVLDLKHAGLRPEAEATTACGAEELLKAQHKELPAAHDHAHVPHSQSLEFQQNRASLVVNPSAPMEATAASPRGEDESAQVPNSNSAEPDNNTPKDGCRTGWKNQSNNVGKKILATQNETKDQKPVRNKDLEGRDECVMGETKEDTSMVRYSVTTTPYLQSVKKTIDDARASSSKRAGNIKDLKFLTPVRRSCRIQRKSCHLPTMLQDHDPCVESLAELAQLDDSPNAFIYRRNPALTEYVSDLPKLTSVHESCN